ncbi:endonuclease III [Candidatus Gracilibacteria bacterium]|nr:endonuclease III [Candidatus Gracilibacteria bacterium]
MTKKEKIELFKNTLFELYPDAITDLQYDNEFQLLIAILMSAQTTDKQVNKVNRNFFHHLKTPQDGIDMGVEEIKDFIDSISFYNNKAENIYKTCLLLRDTYNNEIPHDVKELQKLHGVGVKTAKVFLAVIDDAPFLGVDTHVHRVLNRVGFVTTKNPLQTDKIADKIFSKDDLAMLHNTLIFFGRYNCVARKPKCETCRLQSICKHYKKENK